MKVKKLIKLLSKEDPDATILVSSDPEGNCIQDLHEVAERSDGSICIWPGNEVEEVWSDDE